MVSYNAFHRVCVCKGRTGGGGIVQCGARVPGKVLYFLLVHMSLRPLCISGLCILRHTKVVHMHIN